MGSGVQFKITATTPTGPISVYRPTATDALDTYMDFKRSGFRQVSVKDERGRSLNKDEIALLASQGEN